MRQPELREPDVSAVVSGVSVVVPVHDGGATLARAMDAILDEVRGSRAEIIAVDDDSRDGSPALLAHPARAHGVRVISSPRRGAAAAINAGIRAARYPIVCQVDQDVIVQPGWLRTLLSALADPLVGAAQGRYDAVPGAGVLARVNALDLALRYQRLGARTDHVCTGNSAFRREALEAVGLFDETLGYGYDNDMSYRLAAAGYRLRYCAAARSQHAWPEHLRGYLRQQYGLGYGRLDVVARHRNRVAGDAVSPFGMMVHPVVMAVALAAGVGGVAGLVAGGSTAAHAIVGAAVILLAGLAIERAAAGLRAWWRFGDPAGLLFPVLHLARDACWVLAMVVWSTRRLLSRPSVPAHSMAPRHQARSTARVRSSTP